MSQKFQVPQFIETETKLIGPFTLKQFLFLAGGLSVSALEYILLSGIWVALAVIPTIGFFGALAFARIGGQPFLNYMAYMLAYALGAKRYVYKPNSQPQGPYQMPPTS